MMPLGLIVMIYLVLINLAAFAMMGLDKTFAKQRAWRIPESVLLGAAFIGGALGALAGMMIFRHKTKHLKFTVCVPIFLVVQILAIGYFAVSVYMVVI